MKPKADPLMPLLKSAREERDKYRDKSVEQQRRIEELEEQMLLLESTTAYTEREDKARIQELEAAMRGAFPFIEDEWPYGITVIPEFVAFVKALRLDGEKE